MVKKKLIEVALPLDEINAQSGREKSIRKGHPSTLHLWWARRPLATARAVLFAQLVDDPSERYGEFLSDARRAGAVEPEESARERVTEERQRLFDLIRRMVNWDNINDGALMNEVRAEIRRSAGDNPPAILDPFAGGGTIPLEAQRLGIETHASDLNPVAVLINKALIEIPPTFAGRPPVFPGADTGMASWSGAQGLAEDVRRYGEWMRDEAKKRIGHLYPKATLEDGTETTAIAWIWARTVVCPNPACGIRAPLVRSWWLGKKKGKETYIIPSVVDGRVEYSIGHALPGPSKDEDGTIAGGKGRCIRCQTLIDNKYIRECATNEGLGRVLLSIVAERKVSRVYLPPNEIHVEVAGVPRPNDVPSQLIPDNNHDVDRLPMYGMPTWADAFTNRQLVALTAFSDLVGDVREKVLADALATGMSEDGRLESGGVGAEAYADAVATYLGLVVSRLADYSSSINTWASNPQMEILRNVFARQAIPMAWDYAEGNPFANSSGSLAIMVRAVANAVERIPASEFAKAEQADAATRSYSGVVVSTDPPYYDNIGYSDLSDFFYVWLRRTLKEIHPELFSTMLVPKAEELVANPYRHGGRKGAKEFFEEGFREVFAKARKDANTDYPMTVYYAFKQSELKREGRSSTGWSTILEGMIRSGWTITATWPVRSERAGRMLAVGTNALASSIVLVLRPRPEDATIIDRRRLLRELHSTLPDAIETLRSGGIAPVDLAQAAIGPGIGVFSKYAGVINTDGTSMSVAEALVQINALLDEILSDQDDDLDPDTRWCLAWYETRGFDEGPYGDAETLANARNASIEALRLGGVLNASGGRVSLISVDQMQDGYDPTTDERISQWEVVINLAHALESQGMDSAAKILAGARGRGIDTDVLRSLAYRLYSIAERNKQTKEGTVFNALGSSWLEISAAAADARASSYENQSGFDFDSLQED
ncbi:DUF1156 domain-containing protein [Schaalia cardiffensis]|uniref:DUF1156 domain-containing protein n=1 Tax=Schaalia cardiffensis TaxID=181487 RepID=UPI0018E8E913|nr:DUF1156 domain-containing protein [Schaalia cardiffensis]MBJ2329794.1 DUF1156 domain-containing protein [Schaalia cardiffensis]